VLLRPMEVLGVAEWVEWVEWVVVVAERSIKVSMMLPLVCLSRWFRRS